MDSRAATLNRVEIDVQRKEAALAAREELVSGREGAVKEAKKELAALAKREAEVGPGTRPVRLSKGWAPLVCHVCSCKDDTYAWRFKR